MPPYALSYLFQGSACDWESRLEHVASKVQMSACRSGHHISLSWRPCHSSAARLKQGVATPQTFAPQSGNGAQANTPVLTAALQQIAKSEVS